MDCLHRSKDCVLWGLKVREYLPLEIDETKEVVVWKPSEEDCVLMEVWDVGWLEEEYRNCQVNGGFWLE